jgi:transposase-like protein
MGKEPTQEASIFGEAPLVEALRGEIRGVIERVLAEELADALDAGPYARTEGRAGYRNGKEKRALETSWGKTPFDKPRGRIWKGGREEEFQSPLLPRYQRRCRQVDNEILAMYLGGVSPRKVKRIARLLGVTQTLSPTSVSRVVSPLKEHFDTWQGRSLKEEPLVYLYRDAIAVKVRLAQRVVRRPILVAVGGREDGQKELLGLWSKGSESTASWKDVLQDLESRGLKRPLLAILDGCGGLRAAMEQVWPGLEVQRCLVHKLRNLLRHAPQRAHDEGRDDFSKLMYAQTEKEGRAAYEAFLSKWRKSCESVAKSLEEAREELLTFFRYPKSRWKSLRTTNVIERLHEEFRRRVKTQSSLPNETAILILLYGLLAAGFVRLRKIDGDSQIWRVIQEKREKAA